MKIPGFNILEKIGEGGMAVVWKAHQVSLDRVVAIKLLRPQIATDIEEVHDFINEARAAAKIKHQNIVQVYDVADRNGRYYFVMEFVNGSTVAQILKKESRIGQKNALKIVRCVADALESAWDNSKIIHRDIKPDNIMMDADGTVKLADLGLSKIADPATMSAKIQSGMIEGTPNYMSPEQAQCSTRQDFRTDIYSLGATLYHMVTGTMPFSGIGAIEVMKQHVEGTLPNPRSIQPGVSVATAQLIAKMMMKKPDDRFSSWSETIAAMKKTSAGRVTLSTQVASGVSTIEQPRAGSKATSPVGIRAAASSKPAAPVWVHLSFLGGLAMWWLVLGSLLAGIPKPSAIGLSTRPSSARLATRTRRTATPTGNAHNVNASPQQSPSDDETIYATETLAEEQSAEQAGLTALKVSLAQRVCAKEFTMAKALLENEMEYEHSRSISTEMEALLGIINGASRLGQVLESAFRKQIGRDVIVNHRDVDRRIKIVRVRNGEVTATMTTTATGGSATRPISFTISQLNPLEQSRWLGEPQSMADHTRKFILHMEAGDFATAAELSAHCGPFAAVFADMAQTDI